MLQWYYDFLDKYCDRSDFQYIQMDTDSAYCALSGETLDAIVKPCMRREFYENWDSWIPAVACDDHNTDFVATKMRGEEWVPKGQCCLDRARYDKRKPGLMKEEYNGTGMIALCSKTYFCEGDICKVSTKGISKTQNKLDFSTFANVLDTKVSGGGTNTGFKLKDNKMYTYTQSRQGLTYFYPKRKVLEDGVSTLPLGI
jgi:hypothetical protein